MNRLECSIVVLVVSLLSFSLVHHVYAHTDIHVGDVIIEAGWENEPPLAGELNSIFLGFTKDSNPLVIDPRSITIEVKYGGVVRTIDIEPGEELGTYLSPIIPTRLGSYMISIKGMVDGNNVEAEIPIEDTEDKQKLAFPDTSADSTELKNLASQIQSSVNQLQVTVDQVSGRISNAEDSASEALELSSGLRKDAERAYNFGMMGIGLGAAGVIVAIFSLTRKRKGEDF